ncbi:B33 [miniopterid betaherpesvirus 1]|uniref:B33 n=1 Tax=miniopterid betaherpesvirus 1 TaxID=3070189 RepID=I3VQ08_9BETA|nr:B33 [miniopterid betaherpesvirus 1]AFK83852.1 B33 [miniopterid betaherpesvirus 1]
MDILLERHENLDSEMEILHINSTCPYSESLKLTKGVELFINCAVIMVGLPLNLVVLITQTLANRMTGYSTPAIYMTNLCLSNLLTVAVLPFILMSNNGYIHSTSAGCKFATLLYYSSCTAGFASVGVISVDRYRVVHQRNRAAAKSFKNAYFVLFLIWITAVVCATPAPIYTTILRHDDVAASDYRHETCIIFFEYGQVKTVLAAFKILISLIWGILPVIMMTWFYTFFYRTLRRVSYKKRNRTLVFVCVLLLAFLTLQAPFVVIMLFDSYAVMTWELSCENINSRDAITALARVIPNFHCLINPILYAFVGNDFVTKFRQCIRGELLDKKAFMLARQQVNTVSRPQQENHPTSPCTTPRKQTQSESAPVET